MYRIPFSVSKPFRLSIVPNLQEETHPSIKPVVSKPFRLSIVPNFGQCRDSVPNIGVSKPFRLSIVPNLIINSKSRNEIEVSKPFRLSIVPNKNLEGGFFGRVIDVSKPFRLSIVPNPSILNPCYTYCLQLFSESQKKNPIPASYTLLKHTSNPYGISNRGSRRFY